MSLMIKFLEMLALTPIVDFQLGTSSLNIKAEEQVKQLMCIHSLNKTKNCESMFSLQKVMSAQF